MMKTSHNSTGLPPRAGDQPITPGTFQQWEREIDQFVRLTRSRLGRVSAQTRDWDDRDADTERFEMELVEPSSSRLQPVTRTSDDAAIDHTPINHTTIDQATIDQATNDQATNDPKTVDATPAMPVPVSDTHPVGMEMSDPGEPLDRLQQLKRQIARRLQNP